MFMNLVSQIFANEQYSGIKNKQLTPEHTNCKLFAVSADNRQHEKPLDGR